MLSKISFKNEVWETPILPQIPLRVADVQHSHYALSGQKNGDWEFLFEEIEGMPSPFSKQQDYDFDTILQQKWNSVTVPGSLIMQGFDLKNNVEYYYRRTVSIPADYADKRVLLRFEGIYSNARVWVNNRYLKTHAGGFTCWDCDITDFAQEKEVTLVIGVADLEGTEKGIWNQEGILLSDSAWASHYAHNNIGGILRDVTLYALPNSYLARTHLESVLDENYQNAQLHIDIQLHCAGGDLQVRAELLDKEENVIISETGIPEESHIDPFRFPKDQLIMRPDKQWISEQAAAFENDKVYAKRALPSSTEIAADIAVYSFRLTLDVKNPALWDAEHPNLYKVKLSLFDNGEVLSENLHTIGFRQICYGGMRGTNKNKVYVNGKEIKLHGVCRHDISHTLGRCITKEDAYQEIISYKKNNVNHIRTSHYPGSEYLLSACDQLGIYVEQENSVCFKGANDCGVACEAQEFVNSITEMIESSRNHPSILIWSLGNESGFESTYAFRTEYQYVKAVDTTRPVIFSYPDTSKYSPAPYDIYSMHYASVDGDLGRSDMPMLHDEFAHVACYNHEELIKDNSVREAWGESLKRGWDNIFQTDGALGCAIWGGIDEVFYLPEGTHESHQHHATGKVAGYGEWGAILDVYKREKPEAYLTKKAYSPISVIEEKCQLGENTQLYLRNRFDHTCLTEIRLVCTDSADKLLYDDFLPTKIEPHGEGLVCLPGVRVNDGRMRICFYQGEVLVEESLLGEQIQKEEIQEIHLQQPFQVKEQQDTLFLTGAATSLKIDRKTGKVEMLGEDAKVYAASGGIRQNGELHMAEGKALVQYRIVENEPAVVTVTEDYQDHWKSETTYTFDGVSCHVAVSLFALKEELPEIEALSIEIPLLDETVAVKFRKKGLYTSYPEHHIARQEGTAYKRRKDWDSNADQYGVKPTWDWDQDMSNYFLFDKNCPVTNDFRSKRNHILDYSVCFADETQLSVTPGNCSLSAFVMQDMEEKEPQEILELSLGSYYKSLGWGNYCGEIPDGKGQPQIAFQLTLSGKKE